MRAAVIWLFLAVLWSVDAAFAFRRHDSRQALVAAIAALGFVGVALYFLARGRRRPG